MKNVTTLEEEILALSIEEVRSELVNREIELTTDADLVAYGIRGEDEVEQEILSLSHDDVKKQLFRKGIEPCTDGELDIFKQVIMREPGVSVSDFSREMKWKEQKKEKQIVNLFNLFVEKVARPPVLAPIALALGFGIGAIGLPVSSTSIGTGSLAELILSENPDLESLPDISNEFQTVFALRSSPHVLISHEVVDSAVVKDLGFTQKDVLISSYGGAKKVKLDESIVLYKSPSKSDSIGVIDGDQEISVRIGETIDGWSYIESKNFTGWVILP